MAGSCIVAVVNQKGGVGKTTTAVNLAAALAAADQSVLVVDCDPQGNATTGFGVDKHDEQRTVYDLLSGRCRWQETVRPIVDRHLDLIPSTPHLSGAEVELVSAAEREFVLRRCLEGVASRYEVVLIDCPPSLGLITVNALVAAGSVLVPLQCEYYAMEGLSQLTKTIQLTRKRLNPQLVVEGIVLTMHDQRNNLSEMVAGEVRRHFPAEVYDTVIPRNVRVSEAPSFGKSVLWYDPRSRGSLAYMALATEFMQRRRRSS